MITSVGVGLWVSKKQAMPSTLSKRDKWIIHIAAIVGGCTAAKVPYLVMSESSSASLDIWLENGRTITWGLAGGYIGVEMAKWAMDIREKTGDRIVAPLAAAIAVGRLACFVGGCCYGAPTTLPWGHDFGDAVNRHPTQLYEFAFHSVMAVLFYSLRHSHVLKTQRIKVYFISYYLYRFFTEFIRPEPLQAWGLTFYQLSAIPLIAVFALLFWIDHNRAKPNQQQQPLAQS